MHVKTSEKMLGNGRVWNGILTAGIVAVCCSLQPQCSSDGSIFHNFFMAFVALAPCLGVAVMDNCCPLVAGRFFAAHGSVIGGFWMSPLSFSGEVQSIGKNIDERGIGHCISLCFQ